MMPKNIQSNVCWLPPMVKFLQSPADNKLG